MNICCIQTLRLSQLVLLFATGGALVMFAAGCREPKLSDFRGVPAPLRHDFPYDLNGLAAMEYGGDSFRLDIDGKYHSIVMQGIDAPKRGQDCFIESYSQLAKFIHLKKLRLKVVGRDSHAREIAFVFVATEPAAGLPAEQAEIDVNLEMIRLGMGWYDGNEFPNAEQYRTAEAEARAAKRGLWFAENPQPPWEYQPQK